MKARGIWDEIERSLRFKPPGTEFEVSILVWMDLPGGLREFVSWLPRGWSWRQDKASGNAVVCRGAFKEQER
jgi:hypothetical protein